MTEAEYKQEWLAGMHQSEYNNCRFADDKVQYCKNWLDTNMPWVNYTNPKNIVDIICKQKIRIASDEQYKLECSKWAHKQRAYMYCPEEIRKPAYLAKYLSMFTEKEYNSLPNEKLIIKCSHGSGWNIIIDKNNAPTLPQHVANKINEWLSLNYAYIIGYEAQYESMLPGVIVEPVLIDRPTDYSFWCVNGEIQGISLTKKISKNIEEHIAFVDEHGNQNSWFIGIKPAQDNLQKRQKEIINAMIPYVKDFAKPFDFVRVDMFYINGKIYFGELTFTPCSGRLEYGTI